MDGLDLGLNTTSTGQPLPWGIGKLSMRKAVLQGVVGLAVFAVAWFGLAGRLDWWQGWVLLGVFTVLVSAFAWRLASTDPGLLEERQRPGGDVPAWDVWVLRVYSLMLIIQLALAALDSGRFGWSTVAWGWQVLGWCMMLGAGAAVGWVARSNPFLSSSARLQDDRAQIVVQDGPYAWVRHPMYLAIAVTFIGMSLALASWWALVPAAVNVGLFVYRTVREDEMLKQGLQGYAEYAKRVKFRLLPGIW